MKYTKILSLYFLLFFSLLHANNIFFTDEEKIFIKNNPIINVGVEKDWPPFDFFKDGKYSGIANDYLSLISNQIGIKFNFVADSWHNLLLKTKNKEIDLLPILAKNSNREKYLVYTNSYLTVRDYLFSNQKEFDSLKDLTNKTIAIPKGFAQEEFLRKNHPEIKLYIVKNLLEAIDAVLTQKTDALISNIAIINYLVRENNLSDLYPNFNIGYSGNKLHMAVRSDYIILRNILQKSLNNLNTQEKNIISSTWINNDINNSELNLTKKEWEFIKKKKNLIIANEFDWFPFDFNEDQEENGYVIDYVKLISKKIGLNPIFVTDKWGNLLNKFKKSEIDLLPVISYNKKREKFLDYTKPFMEQTLSLVVKKTTTDIINLDDLKNKKIGLMKDWNITALFRKTYPNANIVEFESINDIFIAIKDNFVDATIQNKLLANYYINKDFSGYLITSSQVTLPSHTSELYMATRKDLKQLNTLINKAISSITVEEKAILDKKWINFGKDIYFTKKRK